MSNKTAPNRYEFMIHNDHWVDTCTSGMSNKVALKCYEFVIPKDHWVNQQQIRLHCYEFMISKEICGNVNDGHDSIQFLGQFACAGCFQFCFLENFGANSPKILFLISSVWERGDYTR